MASKRATKNLIDVATSTTRLQPPRPNFSRLSIRTLCGYNHKLTNRFSLCQESEIVPCNVHPRGSSKNVSSQRRHASALPTATPTTLKHTPLYDVHKEAGAKFGPFAGYDMPLEYPDQSHPESHKWTRENASLFDVSHMVQHKITGPLAEEFLMTICPSSLNTLGKYHSTLSCLLDENGGIVDDTVITKLGNHPSTFYFVTNAGRRAEDLAYITTQLKQFLKSKNIPGSEQSQSLKWHVLDCHSLIALQGPKSQEVLQKLVYHDTEDNEISPDLADLGFGQSRWLQFTTPDGMNTPSLLVSRTGYTGEDGFEISIPSENGDSSKIATAISKTIIGDGSVVKWAGLAARDSLRLEAGMCLYGHDISTDTTPPQAGLGWVIGKDRRSPDNSPPFNGQSKILEHLAKPSTMPVRRVGFLVEKGPAAREGAEILDPARDNEVIGKITSGCPSPSLGGQNIAMGLIKHGYHKKGTQVAVRIRRSIRKAEVAKMPFLPNKFYRPDSKDLEGKEKENNTGL